jgi:kinesin family protein C2/C3
VGAVAGRDLPEEPSEEEFRLGLRNGQILCSALNRVHPGAVQKASPPRTRPVRSFGSLPLSLPVTPGTRARPLTHVNASYAQVVTADSVDGAALSAFQYFENVRNFLVAAQDIGLPCFEASDLEQVRPVSVAASPRPQGLACLLAAPAKCLRRDIFALNAHSLVVVVVVVEL